MLAMKMKKMIILIYTGSQFLVEEEET